MSPPPAQPDPRVLMMISHALDNGVYSPQVQIGLVQCFAAAFGEQPWWREMLDNDPAIAALVRIATHRVVH